MSADLAPVHCLRCHHHYIPHPHSPANQCPHCNSHSPTLSDSPPSDTTIQYQPQPENPHLPHDRRLRQLLIATATVAILAITVYFWQRRHRSDPPPRPQPSQTQGLDPTAHTFITKILATPRWEDLAPHISDPSRVKKLMAWYYTKHPHKWTPHTLAQILQHDTLPTGNTRILRAKVTTHEGPTKTILIRDNPPWSFEWEAWADVDTALWKDLLALPPGQSRALRLHIIRKPGADTHITAAGGHPTTHLAARLWSSDRALSATAIIPLAPPTATALGTLTYDTPLKIIARVKTLPTDTSEPLVTIETILQHGWIWRQKAPP